MDAQRQALIDEAWSRLLAANAPKPDRRVTEVRVLEPAGFRPQVGLEPLEPTVMVPTLAFLYAEGEVGGRPWWTVTCEGHVVAQGPVE